MDCGTSMVKYILFIFNTIVSIIGILSIVYGVLILKSIGPIEVNGQVGFPPQALMPIILISLGSIVVFISFLGCCGAIRESVCMTMSYAVFLLILLILQLTLVILLFTNKEKFENAMGNVIENAWMADTTHKDGVFDTIQKSLHCCGSSSALDYVAKGELLPSSCCSGSCLNPANYYPGCRGKFIKLMTAGSENAKYVGIGLIGVELIGFIFACCLANNVRNYKRRNAY
ncbi:23 kDa integral membrane protein-like [Drosophila sechellia]|uniref:Tetraspanin n=1 Tax=Drosophila sechellia TaxID=7238 RepID=B4IP84_DROSE|nr:23 kDa integral membrane protein-like [Drosophila sechellia]XP_032583269.1 23 kDa integral membrane protein-like [Drosophila sechellia]EDW51570.1 GM18744 [Drosophila sechellia]